MHRAMRGFALICAMICTLTLGSFAQAPKSPQPAKGKSHVLKGKVEGVGADRLTVNHEKVEGYMDAMTMPYKVDKPDILKSVKVGDQISATVYDGDYTLYNIQVTLPQGKSKGK